MVRKIEASVMAISFGIHVNQAVASTAMPVINAVIAIGHRFCFFVFRTDVKEAVLVRGFFSSCC
ncbi:hypothetical protein D3C81_1805180 [compost metagenome]